MFKKFILKFSFLSLIPFFLFSCALEPIINSEGECVGSNGCINKGYLTEFNFCPEDQPMLITLEYFKILNHFGFSGIGSEVTPYQIYTGFQHNNDIDAGYYNPSIITELPTQFQFKMTPEEGLFNLLENNLTLSFYLLEDHPLYNESAPETPPLVTTLFENVTQYVNNFSDNKPSSLNNPNPFFEQGYFLDPFGHFDKIDFNENEIDWNNKILIAQLCNVPVIDDMGNFLMVSSNQMALIFKPGISFEEESIAS